MIAPFIYGKFVTRGYFVDRVKHWCLLPQSIDRGLREDMSKQLINDDNYDFLFSNDNKA